MPEVIAIGLNVVDVLLKLPRESRRGAKHAVQELVITGGAPAGNAACVLSVLGHETAFVSRLGDNTLSGIARDELARCGVSLDFLVNQPEAQPAVAVVEIDSETAERTVYYSLKNYNYLNEQDVPRQAIQASRLILVDSYEVDAAIASLEYASKHGVFSVADIESDQADVVERMVALASDSILSMESARVATGETTPEHILSKLAKISSPGSTVVITDGALGSWATTDSGVIHQPAFMVNARDTTGCGDAYHAAYGSALLRGATLPVRMAFASLYASRVALQLGGRTLLPNWNELVAVMPCSSETELLQFIHDQVTHETSVK